VTEPERVEEALVRLLAEPGVRRWAGGDVPAGPVEAAGWRLAVAHAPGEKAGTIAALKQALALPDHVALNLDALWDGLRDLPVPSVLVWHGWAELAAAEPRTFAVLARLLGERAEEGGFAVLLPGEGPEVGVRPL